MIAGRDTQLLVSVFESELDWMALAESPRGVLGLKFGQPSPRAALAELGFEPAMLGDVQATGRLVRRLQAFARGRYDDFLDVPLDFGRQTPFQQRVVAACRNILPGQWRSYGELAAAAGAPRAARAVGSVMAANRIALLVPCHRVLAAGGRIGGYSLGSGLPLKRQLLDLERGMRPGGKSRREWTQSLLRLESATQSVPTADNRAGKSRPPRREWVSYALVPPSHNLPA